MITFLEVFATVFFGIVALMAVLCVVLIFDEYLEWKRYRVRGLSKKSKKSKDFMTEKESILFIIQERREAVCVNRDSIAEEMDKLNESSEFASLVRCAHYAGYHLTFEQNECKWSADPEYLDPDVFKTDMKEAAALREEREWSEYKRYFDPPRSPREKALGRNIS